MDLDKLKALGLRQANGVISRADDQYLADLEAYRERPVPASYRQFLLEVGPSWFGERVEFRPLAPSPWADNGFLGIDALYGQSDDPGRDALNISLDMDEGFPQQALVLGHDACGNLLFLGLDDSVYFFDHETAEVSLCARDFEGFLDSLQLQDTKASGETGPVQGRQGRRSARRSEQRGPGVTIRRVIFFVLALALAVVLALAVIDAQAAGKADATAPAAALASEPALSYRGIVPGQSRREDVERVFGPPPEFGAGVSSYDDKDMGKGDFDGVQYSSDTAEYAAVSFLFEPGSDVVYAIWLLIRPGYTTRDLFKAYGRKYAVRDPDQGHCSTAKFTPHKDRDPGDDVTPWGESMLVYAHGQMAAFVDGDGGVGWIEFRKRCPARKGG
jgi:hypothetical protein